MSKLDDIGIVGGEDGEWGSKRRYPTKEAFAEALNKELGYSVMPFDITEAYMRYRPRTARDEWEGIYDPTDGFWQVCDGPARGATPVWECS